MLNQPNNTFEILTSRELGAAKWGWACRHLEPQGSYRVVPSRTAEVGDVLVARVQRIRHHTRLMNTAASRVRVYEGDVVVGVVGHRYATDAFDGEAAIEDGGVDLLTNAGLVGQVRRRHAGVDRPTRLSVLGRLSGADGCPINLIDRCFRARPRPPGGPRVLLVVGTGMNAGKTTTAARLVHGLRQSGLRVVGLKATGSVSPNDRLELLASGALGVRDFSDYGFPSTYRLPLEQLDRLVATMLADAADLMPDLVVVELADGILQRETAHLLGARWLQEMCAGVVIASACALSALKGIELVQEAGLAVVGVSGLISSAPLFVDELRSRTAVPVLSSMRDGRELAAALAPSFRSPSRAA